MFTSADIAIFALQFCGVKSPYDLGASSEEFNTALEHFNLLLAEMIGTKTFWWMVPGEQEVPLEVDEAVYDLNTVLGSETPLMMVRDAFVEVDATEERTRISLLRRWEFARDYQPTENTSSDPWGVYIDRTASPQAYVLPTPAAEGRTLILTGLKFPTDIRADGGETETGFPDVWARDMALKTAVDIGAGPVVALPAQRWDRLVKMEQKAEKRLNAFSNRENVQGARYTKPREF